MDEADASLRSDIANLVTETMDSVDTQFGPSQVNVSTKVPSQAKDSRITGRLNTSRRMLDFGAQ